MVQRRNVVIASVVAVLGLAAVGCEEKPATPPATPPANKAPTTPTTPPPAPTGTPATTGSP